MKFKMLLLLCCTGFLFSCDKDRNDSMYDYLQGTWQLVRVGADVNGNQLMETSELVDLPDTAAISTVFNGDGTGYGGLNISSFSLNARFTWVTDEPKQRVTIKNEDLGEYTAAFDATDYNSFTFTTDDLDIPGGRVWLVYVRQ